MDEFLVMARKFHGYLAPGLVIGGFMVGAAQSRLSPGILYDAISETAYCLPDAIQLLTPCTIGNGWLKILDFGRYALSLYDKTTGKGVRVSVDSQLIKNWPLIREWFYKERPKKEQDTGRLLQDILEAGADYFAVREVSVDPEHRKPRHKGDIVDCSVCGEAYPANHGIVCRSCQGENLRRHSLPSDSDMKSPLLTSVPLQYAIGRKLLHDVTEIVPGVSKGPIFRKGHLVDEADLCRLQKIGRNSLYVEDDATPDGFVHENEAARRFAMSLAGEGVVHSLEAVEGKITLFAGRGGLLLVDADSLRRFNRIPGVMGAFRRNFTVVKKGDKLGGARSIPLYLPESDCNRAVAALENSQVIRITPITPLETGILVTGTEVFNGLIKDRFSALISAKVKAYGCQVAASLIAPDDVEAIRDGVLSLMDAGARMVITTAGLSVDPDDVTRQGLVMAGAADMLYGAPILPGAMMLLARIGNIPVMGVPACALFFNATSFDRLLPRALAGVPVTRDDLAEMGHGAFCLECETCHYPNCSFGQ
ncbi:MAG: FmdE family protein [Desulfobacteraceae bacterium]|nr:FmdE family protein [Desulfobacteraceae bacterium]